MITEGVNHCDCVDPSTPFGRLVVEVGKLIPGAVMDGHAYEYGANLGICTVSHDGRRAAFKFKAGSLPSAAQVAEVLAV